MSQHTRDNPPTASMALRLLAGGAFAMLAACTGDDQASPAAAPVAVPGSASQVEKEIGNATVTAVAIQTSQLPDEVAAEHGIEQRDDLVMLRVSPRQGEIGSISTAPAEVRAMVTGLRGEARPLELEERVVNGLVDHVGTLPVTLPETLRFQVIVVSPEGGEETLEFSREFVAR